MTTGGTASGRPRLVDVAERAGVSTATASLVLRGRPGPSEATGDAVRAAAADLGYRPDRTASLLARHRSHLLGVLLDVTSPFHAELVRALDDEAGRAGARPRAGDDDAAPRRAQAVETLLDFRCEALVLLGPQMSAAGLDALAASVPVVVVGRAGTARLVVGVLAADDQGLELAVDHLVALGHQRIAFVDGPRGSIARARRPGYRAAMARHGLGARVDVVPRRRDRGGGRRRGGPALPGRGRRRPTAVIGFNDRSRSGCATPSCARGVRCRRTSRWSATTTARWRDSAPSTSPR